MDGWVFGGLMVGGVDGCVVGFVTECSVMDPEKRRRTDREQFPLLMDWMIVFKKVAAVVICKKINWRSWLQM